ncbi:MAG: universal stress protein [Promethearchaeota archaeon]|nr:MAG: universal stress protein [Candidatus Lokiarchaeota archaeon]
MLEVVIIYKKILFGLDGSENSNRAAKKVIELQKKWNCNVVIFHSIKHPKKIFLYPLVLTASFGSCYTTEINFLTEYEKEAKKILRDNKKIFDEAQVPVESRLIKDENPEDYIERVVKEEGFDLVVVGIKGVHSKLRQIITGSVAQKVIKHTPCDVLIVK